MTSPVTFYIHSNVTARHTMPGLRGKKNFSIASFQEIVDPREGATGMCYIRYMPGESSIFVDKQKAPFDIQKIKSGEHKMDNIKFDSGRRSVEPRETLLLEYLEHAKQNEDNANRNGYIGTQFFKFDKRHNKAQSTKAFTEDNNLRKEVGALDLATLKAIYRAMNEGTSVISIEDMRSDDLRHDVYLLAKKEKGHFERLKVDRILNVRYDVFEALDKGVLFRNAADLNTFIMAATGIVIKQAPQGVNAVDWFAQWLTETGSETYLHIRNILGRNATPGVKPTGETDPTILDEIIDWAQSTADANVSEVFVKNGAHKQFVDDDGVVYRLGNGWESIKSAILKDGVLLTKIVTRYNSVKA